MQVVHLPRLGTFAAWREVARAHAEQSTAPSSLVWQLSGEAPSLFDAFPDRGFLGSKRKVVVPKAFLPLAKQICAHRSPGAFDLAYRLLLSLCEQPSLITNRANPEMAKAERLAKNIRRDMHKMKAFVRFRDVTPAGAARRQFVSWFEPDHRIEELIGGFFTRRFGDMDWIIITPEVTMRFQAGEISYEAVKSAKPDLSDETEALWRTYYANIFNPARLKIKAMQSEMPKKYWKNLPEASLIPDLIAHAEEQVAQMRASAPTLPPVRAGRVLERLHAPIAKKPDGGLEELKFELRGCQRCPLAGPATQTVPGEGPTEAQLMIVGEQPGDHEDIAGRPFVGPAGQMFDQVAGRVGLDRREVYVTNAVKHFKFQVRGKRRIHQSPNGGEVRHCRWWLQKEIALVQPSLIVALGATAAQALTGDGKAITQRRGRIEKGLDDVPVLITWHPAALLRQADPNKKREQVKTLEEDLARACKFISERRQIA
ncbi:MAG: UdgX family uracil-DNA binding protein [Pseudomonadota bacterium]